MNLLGKIINYKFDNSVFRYTPPDHTEIRGERALMVWNDEAYWCVADAELRTLLDAFDGKRALADIIASKPEWKRQAKEVRDCVKTLADKGVLSKDKTPGKPQASHNRTIESVTINVTEKCNLRCSHCYQPEKTGGGGSGISGEKMAAFIASLKRHLSGSPALFILGGEPLAAKEKLDPILAEAVRLGFKTTISTNGTLIDDDLIRLLRSHKFKLQISLDGPDASSNDLLRGKGSFEKTVENIKTLSKHGIRFILCMTCHSRNIDRIEDYYALAKELGASEARVIPLKMIGNAAKNGLKPASTQEIVRVCSSLLKKHEEYRPLSRTDTLSIMLNTCQFSQRRGSCGSGSQAVLLDADGSVYPCLNTRFDFLKLGNIEDEKFDFSKVWNDSKILNEFRDNIEVRGGSSECRGCAVSNWCLGGCHGETYEMKGSFHSKPYNCEDLKQALIDCFWLISDHPWLMKKETE